MKPILAVLAPLAVFALGACTRQVSAPVEAPPPDVVVDYVPEQEILVALPIRVRLPARYAASRVLVFYRTWGTGEFHTLPLSRTGESWQGEISCRDISTVTGDTRYFFLALDGAGQPVLGSGSPEWPHVATIVRSLPEGPRALAGDAPALRCHDPADCPPDFPGCPAMRSRRPACTIDRDCDRGLGCAWDGYCGAPNVATNPDATEEELLAQAVAAAKHQ